MTAPALAEPTAETGVATVGGKDITLGHMIILYSNLPPQYREMAKSHYPP